jgi:allantoin racemase
MLGDTFSVLTQWDGWIPIYKKGVRDLGLEGHLASIRSINMLPDVDNLLGGKEEVVFPMLREAGMKSIEEDGAQVICMGSTTMHQAVPYLESELPVPVINPGPLTYKLAELLLGLRLTHSKKGWPAPNVPKPEMLEAMMRAAAESEQVPA